MSAPFLATVPNGIKFGEITGSATAKQLSNIDCQMVMIQAVSDNAGNVYVGGPSVTIPDGTADTTSGFYLDAKDSSPWIPVRNLNELYIICDNAGDDIVYICIL